MKLNAEGGLYEYDTKPDTCPLCHNGIEPLLIASNVIDTSGDGVDALQILYRCPKRQCQSAFIATYERGGSHYGIEYYLKSTAPYRNKDPELSDEIRSLSTAFTEIYKQAYSAEHSGLDQIAGVGYRKALEFLIKDFCISRHEDKEEEIKKQYLGACIDNYVDDQNLKQCAKRAAWLGNDETHYIRKWEEKDIRDLKILITLSMSWVRNILLTEKYMADMNDGA